VEGESVGVTHLATMRTSTSRRIESARFTAHVPYGTATVEIAARACRRVTRPHAGRHSACRRIRASRATDSHLYCRLSCRACPVSTPPKTQSARVVQRGITRVSASSRGRPALPRQPMHRMAWSRYNALAMQDTTGRCPSLRGPAQPHSHHCLACNHALPSNCYRGSSCCALF
jgi:hypothetical protein